MGVHEGGHASKKIKGIGGRGGGRLLLLVRRGGGHGVGGEGWVVGVSDILFYGLVRWSAFRGVYGAGAASPRRKLSGDDVGQWIDGTAIPRCRPFPST